MGRPPGINKVRLLTAMLLGFGCLSTGGCQSNSKQAPDQERITLIGRVCFADSGDVAYDIEERFLFLPDDRAKQAFDLIFSKLSPDEKEKIQGNIQIRIAYVDKHKAVAGRTRDKRPVVLYDQNFMRKVLNQTKTAWPEIGVIAHEISHHLLNHLQNAKQEKDEEIQADQSAGNLLRRMGASLTEAQAMISFYDDPKDTVYPSKKDRLEAVTRGWTEQDDLINDEESQLSGRTWEVFRIEDINTKGLGDPGATQHWTDIRWIGSQGWLSGIRVAGSGGGKPMDLGKGILLHKTSEEQPWKEIEPSAFDSGTGKFNCDSNKDCMTWSQVGPIHSMLFYPRPVGPEETQIEGWLASQSGIYSSDDSGLHWKRRTPAPDVASGFTFLGDLAGPNGFSEIAGPNGFSEIYAVGWPGILHWTYTSQQWVNQYPTGTYSIARIIPGVSEMWAVGQARNGGGSSDGYGGTILRLDRTQQPVQWKRIYETPRKEANQADQQFSDIYVTPGNTVYAVGANGFILRGQLGNGSTWNWKNFSLPPEIKNTYLNSIAADDDGTLWVVGNSGVIAYSKDNGETWTEWRPLVPGLKITTDLLRIHFSQLDGWIVGKGIVLIGSPVSHKQKRLKIKSSS